jgi:serine/threonine-protein kinase
MGVVYKARDTLLERLVALKVIRADVLAEPDAVGRFYREGRAAAQLKHDHIVGVYDIGEVEGRHYLTMELATGGSLARHKPGPADDPRQVAALVEKVARGVHHAHTKGILHRDLKPGNILLDEHGEPHVSDFGLAKFLGGGAELTQTGVVVGTPAYMAPEQASGQPGAVSPRTDIWALGVILYELLTGRRPFVGESSREVTQQILAAEPPRPGLVRKGISPDLEAVVLKCLEKDPAWRYQTAEDLADDLACWLRGERTRCGSVTVPRRAWRGLQRRTRWGALVALLVLGALGGAGWYLALPAGSATPEGQAEDDPFTRQEVLDEIQHGLAAGKPMTLVGATGRARWSQWLVGKDRARLGLELGGEFNVETFHLGLLELVRDPQHTSFRFAGEVRLDAANNGEVGLYFLGEQRNTAQGPEQYCYALTFAEHGQGPLGGRVLLKLIRHRDPVNGQGLFNWDFYMQEIRALPRPRQHVLQAAAVQGLVVPGSGLTPPAEAAVALGVATYPIFVGQWRRLVVDVTPEGIAASFDGAPLPTNLHAKMRPALHTVWRAQFPAEAANPPPTLAPRSSLGLLVRRADAGFRNVTVTPLGPWQGQ